jgi:hypothetical protein
MKQTEFSLKLWLVGQHQTQVEEVHASASCSQLWSMKYIVYFRILLVVLLLGGPIMACAIPDAQLTAAEKQCCKDMSGDCQQDASGMPMSHSCCKTSVQPPHDFRPSSTFSSSTPYLVISAVDFPPVIAFAEQCGEFTSWLRRAPSPPLATLGASAPLRI